MYVWLFETYVPQASTSPRLSSFHHLQRRFRVLSEQEAKGKQRPHGVSAAGSSSSTERGSADDLVNTDLVLETEEGVIRATSRNRASAGSGM